jgi:hypothetical protein
VVGWQCRCRVPRQYLAFLLLRYTHDRGGVVYGHTRGGDGDDVSLIGGHPLTVAGRAGTWCRDAQVRTNRCW